MEQKIEQKVMDFGKTYRIGNFLLMKGTKTLNRKEVEILRDEAGIPSDVRKHLSRAGLPYIRVSAISGTWSITYTIGMQMYSFIEFEVMNGKEGEGVLANILTNIYGDANILGDAEYWEAKRKALYDLLNRQSSEVDKEADDKELESLKVEYEARENIKEMAEHIKEEGGVS